LYIDPLLSLLYSDNVNLTINDSLAGDNTLCSPLTHLF
jgi:hypothetical protein